jgi:crotonobetainyl-CoA:carnitine CoA-transferase CaiB-like acyl-CoA transferase
MGKKRPLDGVRIVDGAQWWAGPIATTLLGDLGADIVKIESIQHPDPARLSGAILGGFGAERAYEKCGSFIWMNRNKRGITVNLTIDEGREILRRLIRSADVVVQNLRPGVWEGFGFTYDAIRALRENIVYLTLPGYGNTGPWKDYASYASPVEQMSGFSNIVGYEGGGPMTHRPWQDESVAVSAAFAVVTALYQRRRTGRGQAIDFSQTEVATTYNADVLLDYALNGRVWGPHGNRSPAMAPHGVYRSADGRWVAVAVRDDAEWERLCRLIGRDDLRTDQSLTTSAGRLREAARLDAAVADWLVGQPADAAVELLQRERIPASVASDGKSLLRSAQLRARDFIESVERPEVGRQEYPGSPFRFGGERLGTRRPAPLLGEHTAELLGELGYSDDDLRRLEADKVIGAVPLTM